MTDPIKKELGKERDRCTKNFYDEVVQWIRDDINDGEWTLGTETKVVNIPKSEEFSPCRGDIIRCYGNERIYGVDIIKVFESFYNPNS